MQIAVTIKQKLEEDINYIKKEIITKQPDGNYCKFSRALNELAYINMPKEKYFGYWEAIYKKYPEESKKVLKTCENKFKNSLISIDTMISLIEEGNDRDSEKVKAIKVLKGIK